MAMDTAQFPPTIVLTTVIFSEIGGILDELKGKQLFTLSCWQVGLIVYMYFELLKSYYLYLLAIQIYTPLG